MRPTNTRPSLTDDERSELRRLVKASDACVSIQKFALSATGELRDLLGEDLVAEVLEAGRAFGALNETIVDYAKTRYAENILIHVSGGDARDPVRLAARAVFS